jgi:hypothetical protein
MTSGGIMRAPLIVTALSLTLLACQPLDPGPGTDLGEDTCGASAYAHLVGARAAVAEGISAPGPVRVLRPGEAVTLEFRGDRLNVALDARDRIVRIYCG